MKKKVGTISVDAGICWIGDPCYILHKGEDLPKSLGSNWDEFCANLDDETGYDGCAEFSHDGVSEGGLGVCVPTGYGDGEYPVFVEIDEQSKRVKSVTVKFF